MVDAMPNAAIRVPGLGMAGMAACRIRFTAGPKFIQIGNEGGFIPLISVRDNQPVNYDYDRGSATFGNVQNLEGLNPTIKGTTIFLGPAERADVIVDFSTVAPGTNVILYNDAPAPVPGFIPKYDYYTGNPDSVPHRRRPPDPGGHRSQHPDHHAVPGRRALQPRLLTWPPWRRPGLAIYTASQPPPIVPQTYYPTLSRPSSSHPHLRGSMRPP